MSEKERKESKPVSAKLNFIYNSAYHIFAIIVPLITTPYLSRTLGASGLGDYSFAYSIAYYFGIVITLGLKNYGGRQVAYIRGDRKELSKQFWEMYSFQLLLGIISSVVYSLFCLISHYSIIHWILILYVISAALDITWFYWGLEEFRMTVRRDFIIKIFTTAGIFIFVKSAQDTWLYALLLSTGFLGSQALLWPTLHRYVDFVKPTRAGVIRHIKPNLVLFIPTIAVSLYKMMDKVMLGVMSDNTEVGLYQSSENLIQVPMALVTSLATVMQPRMSNMISRNVKQSALESTFSKSIMLSMFLSTSIGFGIMAVSQEFVPLFYGAGFEKCVSLLQILLPSCMFLAFASVIRTQFLIPRKKDKEFIISLFSGAGVNLVLNSILIPPLASVGAAIGTLCAEAAVCFVQAFLTRHELNTGKYAVYSLPFVFSGLVMFLLWNNRTFTGGAITGLLIKIIVGGCTYLVVLGAILAIWKGLSLMNNRKISGGGYRELGLLCLKEGRCAYAC